MTLVELVVVLGLLAAVATLALTSVDGLSDRSRADTTDLRLEQVRRAVTDFVNDMGRVPVVRDITKGRELCGLWDEQWGCLGNTYPLEELDRVFEAYDEEVGFDGWRGPYLEIAYDQFFDGFGNPFCNSEGGEWAVGDEIYVMGSLGRDGLLEDDGNAENGWASQDVFKDWTNQVRGNLTVILRVQSSDGSWVSPRITETDGPTWLSSETYKLDDLVRDESEKYLYCCCHPTSSMTEPNGFSDGDPVIVDSDLVWSQRHAYFNNLYVVVFAPYASTDQSEPPELSVRTLKASYGEGFEDGDVTASWTGSACVNFTNLPVGLRYILAYGYVRLGDNDYNAWTSGLQAVEVTSSTSVLTVHLNEDLSEGGDS